MVKTHNSNIKSLFNNLLRKRANLVFAVIPILLFLFLLFRLAEIHFFYQCWYDPVYAYLMNGLTFALGSNDIGHFNHPGTPLQLFCALVFKITGLIRGADNLAFDVIANPENYLLAVSLTLIVFNCLMIWVLGLFAYRNLRNRNLAIIVQLFSLLTFELVKYIPILTGESVIVLSSIAIVACIILYDFVDKGIKSIFIAITILSALIVSTKISALSILIVPFFFFEKLRFKISYLLFSILFMFLFITPVLNKMGLLFDFIKAMATHTGNFGLGDEKLIDWTIFFQSLRKILFKEFTFTVHIILLLFGWILIFKNKINGSLRRLYMGITLATIFQTMLVARHYSIHYMMPVYALAMPLHGYFWIRFYQQKIGAFSTRIVSMVTIVLVVGVFTRLIVKNQFEKGLSNPVEKTSQLVRNKLKGSYIILTDYNNGSAFIEPALKFGYGYSGNRIRNLVSPILAAVYPDNYLWNSRDGLTKWTGSILPADVFSRDKEIYIYACAESCIASMLKITEMVDQMEMSEFVELRKMYQNEETNEVIVNAFIDTAQIIQNNIPRLVIETGMEELAPGGEKINSDIGVYTFKGGQLRSGLFARSGNTSLLLTPSNPFALGITIPVKIGKRYKVEFWQLSYGKRQTIAVSSASQSELFYRTSNDGENQSGMWNRSQFAVTLPAGYPEDSINFYLWNPHADSVWVDDFKLEIFE